MYKKYVMFSKTNLRVNDKNWKKHTFFDGTKYPSDIKLTTETCRYTKSQKLTQKIKISEWLHISKLDKTKIFDYTFFFNDEIKNDDSR